MGKFSKALRVPGPEVVGWLEREVRRYLYGHSDAEIIGSPRVAGGMTMPAEV